MPLYPEKRELASALQKSERKNSILDLEQASNLDLEKVQGRKEK
jgi:hypothetical protein|tara:strand:- start:349 stop:480 length:132 start_codon:yes stop_codon:yes gene_type:complete